MSLLRPRMSLRSCTRRDDTTSGLRDKPECLGLRHPLCLVAASGRSLTIFSSCSLKANLEPIDNYFESLSYIYLPIFRYPADGKLKEKYSRRPLCMVVKHSSGLLTSEIPIASNTNNMVSVRSSSSSCMCLSLSRVLTL